MIQSTKKWLTKLIILVLTLYCSNGVANTQTLETIEAKIKSDPANISQITGYLQRYLKMDPNEHQARILLARAYFHAKDLDSAEKILLQAKQMGASPNLWLRPLGRLYRVSHKYQALLENLTESDLVRYNDTPAPSLFSELILFRADAFLGLNQGQEAKIQYLALTRQNPNLVHAWLGLAKVYLLEKNNPKALSALDEAKHASKIINKEIDSQILSTQGAIYFSQNRKQQANLAYEHALRLDPSNLDAHLGSLQLLCAGKVGESFYRKAQRLYQLFPNHPDILYYAAFAHHEKGDNKKAKLLLEKLKSLSPNHHSADQLMARLYFFDKEYTTAEQTLKPFLIANPEDAAGKALMTAIHIKLKRAQKSEVLPPSGKEKMVDPKPLASSPLFLSTEIALKEQNFDKAFTSAQKLVKAFPKDPKAYRLLGQAYLALDYPNQTVNAFQKAYELSPTEDNLKALFHAKHQVDAVAEAYELLNDWLEDHPDNLEMKRFLATHYLQDNKTQEALTEYEAILAVSGNDVVALNNLATLTVKSDVRRALQLAEKAFKLAPHEPKIADTLAWVWVHKGKPLRAKPLLESALKQEPENPEIRYHYAVTLEKLGDIKGAKGALALVMKNSPEFSESKNAHLMWQKLEKSKS
ncbi:MAG TPA: tetratricopeptide repeat protein [Gammaproteobacteria bacterium]|nr:tetratricopeptide repeat protein [Gammaproteobacteria bacterium]